MIKFAVLTPGLGQPGGAERTILIQVRYADPERMRCTGIALSGWGPLDLHLGRALRCHTTIHGDTPRGHRQRPKSDMVKTTYVDLNAAVRHVCRDADVLVTWGSLKMGQHAAGLEIPVICVSHAPVSGGETVAGITHLVAVSEVARNYFAEAPGCAHLPVEVIPNGVEVDRASPRRGRTWQRAEWGLVSGDKALLYLARQTPTKNPWASIEVLAKLPPNHKLIMVGNQANDHARPLPRLAQLADELGVADRVKFLPPEPFVGDILAGADCLMHLSAEEADSLALKEAFLAGLPVVHSPAGAIPAMEAEFGPVGWGVDFRADGYGPASVDPDAVAVQVRLALSDAARPVAAKMRALAWERWTGHAMCDRWADYLERVVAEWNEP